LVIRIKVRVRWTQHYNVRMGSKPLQGHPKVSMPQASINGREKERTLPFPLTTDRVPSTPIIVALPL